jgi:hypothetical protein
MVEHREDDVEGRRNPAGKQATGPRGLRAASAAATLSALLLLCWLDQWKSSQKKVPRLMHHFVRLLLAFPSEVFAQGNISHTCGSSDMPQAKYHCSEYSKPQCLHYRCISR